MRSVMNRLNRDLIKYIVIILMTLNHAAWALLPRDMVLFYVFSDLGYATCITMCYFLVEGSRYTGSAAAYRLRLIVFALIAQIPYQMAVEGDPLRFGSFNVLFNLLLCQLMVSALADSRSGGLRVPPAAAVTAVLIVSVFCDWGPMAPLFTALFYYAGRRAAGDPEKKRREVMKAYAVSAAAFFLYEMLFPTDGLEYAFVQWSGAGRFGGSFLELKILSALSAVGGVLLSMVLVVFCYSGKRAASGRAFHKYFFYAYYPLHLLIIGLIRILR